MVDVSMFETLVGMLLGEVNRAQFDFEMPSRPMYGPVEAKDGYVMLATASERTFQDMATAAGRRDWLTDPRFEKYADRRMNWDKFVDEFEAWSKTLTVKECVAALEKHGVPCSPYLTVTEALQDPQVAHRGSLCTIEDSAGTYKSPAPPFRFSGSPCKAAPKVGEHQERAADASAAESHWRDDQSCAPSWTLRRRPADKVAGRKSIRATSGTQLSAAPVGPTLHANGG